LPLPSELLLDEPSTGIVRASWPDDDLTLLARSYIVFTREHAIQMQSRLAERARGWQVQKRTVALLRH